MEVKAWQTEQKSLSIAKKFWKIKDKTASPFFLLRKIGLFYFAHTSIVTRDRRNAKMIEQYGKLIEMVKNGKSYCTPEDVKEYLDTDPKTIRSMAHDCPEKIGFKVVLLGKMVRIPIIPFIMIMTGAGYETIAANCA